MQSDCKEIVVKHYAEYGSIGVHFIFSSLLYIVINLFHKTEVVHCGCSLPLLDQNA